MRIDKSVLAALTLAAAVTAVSCGGGSGSSTAPTPTPVSTVTAPLPWVYSQIFSTTSPFHTTVAALKANGATNLPQSLMTSLWSQGIPNQDLSTTSWNYPVYVSVATDPTLTFHCANQWGSSQWYTCNADGMSVHVPAGALPEPRSDGHIGIIDTSLNQEIDGWACTVSSTAVTCAWGGKYALGGSGIENTGSGAVHAGYAAGLFEITAQELLNGKIDHALGLDTNCLNNPTVYPADQDAGGTDQSCGTTASASYGNLVHLLWTPAQIASSPYSTECKTVLTALSTYGAYTFDTGNYGLSLLAQHQFSYTAIGKTSPWATTILPDLKAAGDSDGAGWQSCLNRLNASDFELLQIPAGSY